jgi:hypothetical protein
MLNERHHSEDLGVDWKIISEWILGIQVLKVWIEFIWLRIEADEHGNEPSGSIKSEEFIDYLREY